MRQVARVVRLELPAERDVERLDLPHLIGDVREVRILRLLVRPAGLCDDRGAHGAVRPQRSDDLQRVGVQDDGEDEPDQREGQVDAPLVPAGDPLHRVVVPALEPPPDLLDVVTRRLPDRRDDVLQLRARQRRDCGVERLRHVLLSAVRLEQRGREGLARDVGGHSELRSLHAPGAGLLQQRCKERVAEEVLDPRLRLVRRLRVGEDVLEPALQKARPPVERGGDRLVERRGHEAQDEVDDDDPDGDVERGPVGHAVPSRA